MIIQATHPHHLTASRLTYGFESVRECRNVYKQLQQRYSFGGILLANNIIKFIELFQNHRNILLKILFFPSIVIFFASEYKKKELETLYYYLPKPSWIYGTFESIDILLNWLAIGGVVIFGAGFILTLSFYLFVKFVLKKNIDIDDVHYWIKTVNLGLIIIFESSFWWSILFTIKILYKVNRSQDYFDPHMNFLMSYPTLIYIIIYLFEWLLGRKLNSQ